MRLALLRIRDINNRSMLFNNLIHPYIFMAKSYHIFGSSKEQ